LTALGLPTPSKIGKLECHRALGLEIKHAHSHSYFREHRNLKEAAMNDRPHGTDNALDRTDEDDFTVSDEALEKAAGGASWAPMLTGVATVCDRRTVITVRRSGLSSK
jgi:hypothetical protein